MNYYFDPTFGYFCITGESRDGTVRYGRGPVSPHDEKTLEEQRFTRFETWVEIPPHHVPDDWLIAFADKEPKKEERIVVDSRPPVDLGWGFLEWMLFAIVVVILGYTAIKL